jgi:hypothetical protein
LALSEVLLELQLLNDLAVVVIVPPALPAPRFAIEPACLEEVCYKLALGAEDIEDATARHGGSLHKNVKCGTRRSPWFEVEHANGGLERFHRLPDVGAMQP